MDSIALNGIDAQAFSQGFVEKCGNWIVFTDHLWRCHLTQTRRDIIHTILILMAGMLREEYAHIDVASIARVSRHDRTVVQATLKYLESMGAIGYQYTPYSSTEDENGRMFRSATAICMLDIDSFLYTILDPKAAKNLNKNRVEPPTKKNHYSNKDIQAMEFLRAVEGEKAEPEGDPARTSEEFATVKPLTKELPLFSPSSELPHEKTRKTVFIEDTPVPTISQLTQESLWSDKPTIAEREASIELRERNAWAGDYDRRQLEADKRLLEQAIDANADASAERLYGKDAMRYVRSLFEPGRYGVMRMDGSKYTTRNKHFAPCRIAEHGSGGITAAPFVLTADGKAGIVIFDEDTLEGTERLRRNMRFLEAGNLHALLDVHNGKGHLSISFDRFASVLDMLMKIFTLAPELMEVKECWPLKNTPIRLLGGLYCYGGANTWCEVTSSCDSSLHASGREAILALYAHRNNADLILHYSDEEYANFMQKFPIVETLVQKVVDSKVKGHYVPKPRRETIASDYRIMDEGKGVDDRHREKYGLDPHFDIIFTHRQLIAERNAGHSLRDVIYLNRQGKGRVKWRKERTESVALNDDGTAHDYGENNREDDLRTFDYAEWEQRELGMTKSEYGCMLGKEAREKAIREITSAARRGLPMPESRYEYTPYAYARYKQVVAQENALMRV
jgi:hypothetical protein